MLNILKVTAKERYHHTPVRKTEPTVAITNPEGDKRIGPSKGSEVWRTVWSP